MTPFWGEYKEVVGFDTTICFHKTYLDLLSLTLLRLFEGSRIVGGGNICIAGEALQIVWVCEVVFKPSA